jgi:hypothetical protein
MYKERFSLYFILVYSFLFMHVKLQSQPFFGEENILVPSRCMMYYSVPIIDSSDDNYYWFINKTDNQLQSLNEIIYNDLAYNLIKKSHELEILCDPDFKEQNKYDGDWNYYDGTDSSINAAVKTTEENYWKRITPSIDSSAFFDIYFPYFIDFAKRVSSSKYRNIEKIVAESISQHRFKTFRFVEDWKFNSHNMTFDKKVIAYSITPADKDSRIFYFVKPSIQTYSLTNSKQEKIVENFYYEYFFDSYKNQTALYLNEYMQTSLILFFYNSVRANKINAYDFYTKEKLKLDDLAARLNFIPLYSPGNYLDSNPFPVKVIEPAYFTEEFKSIIFEENWYINPENLQFTKEVTGLSFVRYYYDEKDVEKKDLIKKICFYVSFNKSK